MAEPSTSAQFTTGGQNSPEHVSLISGRDPQFVGGSNSRTTLVRRILLGGAVGLTAAVAVAWKISAPCVPVDVKPSNLGESLVSLSEQYPQDLGQMYDKNNDHDAVVEWLTKASAKAKTKASAAGHEALKAAMEEKNPAKAQEIFTHAIKKSVKQTQEKRKELKQFVAGKKRFMTKTSPTPSPAQGDVDIAYCVFDVMSAVTTAVNVAANINDAVKTCENVQLEDMFSFEHDVSQIHDKVCSINAIAVISNLNSIAGALSIATDSCSLTLIPNIDAKCAAAVTGLVTATSALAGGGTLISSACKGTGWYSDIPEGIAPSNLGSNDMFKKNFPEQAAVTQKEAEEADAGGRRLSGPDGETEEAPARQLLFGGGKGSTATHCSMEITSVLWNLASFAFSINTATNEQQGASCPPSDLLGGKRHLLGYGISQSFCTLDITSAITSILQIIATLQLIVINCADVLNIRAICGTGVAGVFAGATGIAQAATGLHLACDLFQHKGLKKIINLARGIDAKTGLISGLADNFNTNLGRRLGQDSDESIKFLKDRFKSPEEVFQSIGFDLNNSSSFWKQFQPSDASTTEITSLFEQGGSSEGHSRLERLFSTQQTCET